MDRKSGRSSQRPLLLVIVLLSICFSSSATETNSSTQEGLRSSLSGKSNQYKSRKEVLNVAMTIGSTPPACTGRCERCTPCKAVSVPPGSRHVTKEYYPSVWRCKCGSKLYMPGRPPPATHS